MSPNIESSQAPQHRLLAALRGLPLTGSDFNAALLVSLVAEKRRRHWGTDVTLDACLDPESAHLLYRRVARQQVTAPDVLPFSDVEARRLVDAKRDIVRVCPSWKPFFELPVLFRKLGASPPELPRNAPMISFTNHYVPQQIYLGENAFESDLCLQEVVIHELSHVWMGLICELSAIQATDCRANYTLPSGTSGKDARGTIFAGMFATSVVAHLTMRQIQDDVDMQFRIDHLTRYQQGCVALVDGSSNLTPLGQCIVDFMKQEFLT